MEGALPAFMPALSMLDETGAFFPATATTETINALAHNSDFTNFIAYLLGC
jgi:hypothetical protein